MPPRQRQRGRSRSRGRASSRVCDMELDVEQGPMSHDGPANMEERVAWVPKLVADLSRKADGIDDLNLAEKLISSLQRGILCITDCSGIGMPEMMLGALAKAVQEQFGVNVAVRQWRCTDVGPHQRSIALNDHDGPEPKPQHVFGNLIGFLPENLHDALRLLLDVYVARKHSMECGGTSRADLNRELSSELLDGMCRTLMSARSQCQHDRKRKAHCYKCNAQCFIYPPAMMVMTMITLAICGTPCVTWSTMGNGAGWIADTMLAFASWI